MNIRTIAFIGIAFIVTGCAGAALKKEWTARGYSAEDTQLMADQSREYQKRLIEGQMSSNAFNSAPRQVEEARLRALWCNCWRRMKDKCRQKPDGLSAEDKALWSKANAVEMAFASQETTIDVKPNTRLDGDECS